MIGDHDLILMDAFPSNVSVISDHAPHPQRGTAPRMQQREQPQHPPASVITIVINTQEHS